MPRPDSAVLQGWKTWAILAWVVLIAGLYAGTLARSRPGIVIGAQHALARLAGLRR
jgi:hypothetical protein